MDHSFSVSELRTVCSVHVANYPFQVVSVHFVRDSGECQSPQPHYCQSIGHYGQCANKWGTIPYSALQIGRGVVQSG